MFFASKKNNYDDNDNKIRDFLNFAGFVARDAGISLSTSATPVMQRSAKISCACELQVATQFWAPSNESF